MNTPPPRFWSRESYHALLAQIHTMAAPHGEAKVYLDSQWRSDVRWSRNRILEAGDWRDVRVAINYCDGGEDTNQADLGSIRGLLNHAESMMQRFHGGLPGPVPPVQPRDGHAPTTPYLWSESTYNQTEDTRLQITEQLITDAEAAGMVSAGYISVSARGYVLELSDGRVEYVPITQTECTITVRDPSGSGSGWAGLSSYDWGRIDAAKLAATALDKCLKSRNPVRIEPGRYTLIMESQATYDLLRAFMDGPKLKGRVADGIWSYMNEKRMNGWPFHESKKLSFAVSQYKEAEVLGTTKLGQRVMDPRVTLGWYPTDPNLGRVPFRLGAHGTEVYPLEVVQWVTNGVLTALATDPGLTVNEMRMNYGDIVNVNGVPGPGGFRMDGGPTSIDEMIATTKRGLLVTRFSEMQGIFTDAVDCLLTGTTRDGLWLIENGKIVRPVINMRWVESPMFALNQVEQIGPSVPVFVEYIPGDNPMPAMTPPVKVRDFHFTALVDSV